MQLFPFRDEGKEYFTNDTVIRAPAISSKHQPQLHKDALALQEEISTVQAQLLRITTDIEKDGTFSKRNSFQVEYESDDYLFSKLSNELKKQNERNEKLSSIIQGISFSFRWTKPFNNLFRLSTKTCFLYG